MLRQAFHGWVSEFFTLLGIEQQIAIDGQTHRGSGDKGKGKKPVHMVHALVCETGLVMGQVATEEKSNEIKAIPALLELLDLRGALVSIDAMGTQVKIARQIVKAGGDYLLALKGSQSSLHTEVEAAFEEARAIRTAPFLICSGCLQRCRKDSRDLLTFVNKPTDVTFDKVGVHRRPQPMYRFARHFGSSHTVHDRSHISALRSPLWLSVLHSRL